MLSTLIKLCAFLCVVCAFYFIMPKGRRGYVLLAGNLLFYLGFGNDFFLFLCIAIVTTYVGGRLLDKQSDVYAKQSKTITDKKEKKRYKEQTLRKKRWILFVCLVINLGLWAFLKCSELIVVFGISYYSFVASGYLIDVYRGRYKSEKNILRLSVFLSFFLHMIQGPFSRYDEVQESMFADNDFSKERLYDGGMRILWGIFKKCLIADKLSVCVTSIYAIYEQLNGVYIFIAMILFGIQLYADFSGYMDIMLGFARILGIHMAENFRQPFFARSIEEFWRRWHITLGAWFKNYLFYPVSMGKWAQKIGVKSRKLLGNRTGRLIPSYMALLLVWSATGLWHGFAAHYWVWGMMQMFVIVFSMQMESVYQRIHEATKISAEGKVYTVFQCLRTFLLFCFMEIMSEAATVRDAWNMYVKMFTDMSVRSWSQLDIQVFQLGVTEMGVVILGICMMLVVDVLKENNKSIKAIILQIPVLPRYMIYVGISYLILIMCIGSTSTGGFMYARF